MKAIEEDPWWLFLAEKKAFSRPFKGATGAKDGKSAKVMNCS